MSHTPSPGTSTIVDAASASFLDWLVAVGTLLAVIVPLVFFMLERRDRKAADLRAAEADRRREDAEDQRWEAEERYRREELERLTTREKEQALTDIRSRAAAIHVWLEEEHRPVAHVRRFSDAQLVVSNQSQSPIRGLAVTASETFAPVEREPGGLRPVLSRELLVERRIKLFWHLVPPTGRDFMRIPLTSLLCHYESTAPGGYALVELRVEELIFTDAAHRQWSKDARTGTFHQREWRTGRAGRSLEVQLYDISAARLEEVQATSSASASRD